MHTRHKWGKSELDVKHRRYKAQDVRVRQCSVCGRKVYGTVRPREHVIDMQGRNPTPV